MAGVKKKALTKQRVVSKKVAKKKVASKKRVTKKAPTKKVKRLAKKRVPAKKVAKKQVKRKVAKKITKSTIKISKKLTVKTSEKKTPAKVVILNNCEIKQKRILKPEELKIVTHSRKTQLIPQDFTLGQVARHAGMTLVLVGAIFSAINLYSVGIWGGFASSGQVATIHEGEIPPPEDPPPEELLNEEEHDPKPDVKISVAGGGMLTGQSDITITVPYAQEVLVIVKSLDHSIYLPLGPAYPIDDTTWKFLWDTEQFEDAEYKIKAVIYNQYGEYDHTAGIVYTLENYPDEPEIANPESIPNAEAVADTTEDVSTTADETDTSEGYSNDIQVESDVTEHEVLLYSPEFVTGDTYFEVVVLDAEKVKLIIKHLETGNHYLPDNVSRIQAENWGIRWDSTRAPDGPYKIFAEANIGGDWHKSDYQEMFVENNYEEDYEEEPPVPKNEYDPVGEAEEQLNPDIQLKIYESNPVSGGVEMAIHTSPVDWVDIFIAPKYSSTFKYLGFAKKQTGEDWSFLWDTKQTPNGEYALFATVKTKYGSTDGERVPVVVKNDLIPQYTEEQESYIAELKDADDSLIEITEKSDEETQTSTPLLEEDVPEPKYIDPAEKFVGTINDERIDHEELVSVLADFRSKLNELLNDLARATRYSDQKLLEETRVQMLYLKNEIIREVQSDISQKDIVDKIDAYISQITFELEEVTLQNERILKERTGDNLFKDSDNDSISDYDEINLYKTNPFSADSDGDGFIDGAEIESGFNPNDSSREALIAYESPKETGIVQEELFVVEEITTFLDGVPLNEPKKALIKGKALPNSYVTIYIFSEPIIVTVRTDADGGWQYVFDKELDDGEHEIYVGVTDNAGKIVGKSKPLRFVKTAEAYTASPAEIAPVTPDEAEKSLLSTNALLLTASLIVVSLGLVLILLGLHVSNKRQLQVVESV